MRPYIPSSRRAWWALLVASALLVGPPAVVGAVVAAVVALALLGRPLRRAAWRAVSDARVRRGDATLLGADARGAALVLDDRQLAAHGLILGASGAGKTTTLLAILTDHIHRGRPVVAIDLKGSPDFARRLEQAAAAAGRPFRVWSPDGPVRWNPLAHGTTTELKDKLIATERFSEPHYQRAAERYLQIALGVLRELHPDRPPTLEEVVAALEPQKLESLSRGLLSGRREHVQDYLATLSADQLSGVRGFATRMAILTESDTGHWLGGQTDFWHAQPGQTSAQPPDAGMTATVDLRDALDGREVVLFSLNSSSHGKLSAQLGTMVIQDLVAAAGERLRQDAAGGDTPRALIGIDEFSALDADNVMHLLARGRESEMSVLLATQELADLDRAGRGLRDQVLGVTSLKIAHRQDVPASAQTVAEMAGTVMRWEETRSTGVGLLHPAGARRTRRQVERLLVHPNEIKTLRTGQALVISRTPRSSVRKIHVSPPHRVDGREL